jgi:PAS domain S-box-containing protein
VSDDRRTPPEAGFLQGAGELAGLIRTFDWAATPLGPIGQWPASLKTITGFLVHSTVPMVLLWGPDGVMIYNDAYAVFAGSRHPRILGAKVRDGWPEVAAFNDNVMKVGLGGGTLAYKDQELTLYRNGKAEQVWMNLDYSPVLDDSGTPAGVMAIVIETTERVLAARRVAARQDWQRQLLSQMPGFVGVLAGPDHVYEYVNDAFVKIAGRDGFVGNTVRQMFPELAGQGFFELLDRVYRTGEPVVMRSMELRLQGSDEVQYIDFVYQPIRDAAGHVSGIFVGGYEVTEAHRAVAALRASEASLRELNAELERRVIERTQARGRTWQVSPDLLGALNSQGYFETSNPAWQTVLGWSEAEIASMSIFELLHPEDVEGTRAGFELTQQGQPAIRFPNRYRCKDGSYRWISWVGVPEDGMVYCSGRDITDEVAAEERHARTEEALRQSQKMEAVGQLTGGIAHDFNNMPAIALGSLDLATRRLQRGDSGVQRYLDNAREGVTRAASLTQRLLAFSRQSPLMPRVTDLNALVGSMSELLRRTLGEHIVLEAVLSAGTWRANVDPNQLESAIVNLAVNARDAMPDGGKLTIEIANVDLDDRYAAREVGVAAGQYVMISVTDVGAGMPPDVVERAFDPFFTTKEVGKGTGLGLSMVYGFAKQSGGHVRLYSELGHGTTAKIYLPRHFGSVGEATTAAAAPSMPLAGRTEIVLVVEDDVHVRQVSVEALRELGYTVHVAGSGEEALRQFDAVGRIDILFTDIVMPGMNGRQLAEALKEKAPTLKVLFTTGYARNAVVHGSALDPGMAFISKPFTLAGLAAKVRAVLDS